MKPVREVEAVWAPRSFRLASLGHPRPLRRRGRTQPATPPATRIGPHRATVVDGLLDPAGLFDDLGCGLLDRRGHRTVSVKKAPAKGSEITRLYCSDSAGICEAAAGTPQLARWGESETPGTGRPGQCSSSRGRPPSTADRTSPLTKDRRGRGEDKRERNRSRDPPPGLPANRPSGCVGKPLLGYMA